MKISGNRLLIVEDEPLLRITMADALRKEGWVVDVAEDGVKGAAYFEQHLHDLVLADLVMPRMGGMDLLKRISALQPDCTVIIITAHGTVDRAVEAMREGASDFITKPFSMAQLIVRLSNVCSVRLLQQLNVRLQEQLEQLQTDKRAVEENLEARTAELSKAAREYRKVVDAYKGSQAKIKQLEPTVYREYTK